jgi:chromosome partitioning protein
MKNTKRIYEVYMIVVVGGVKGGSGKTTIATNLAVMRSASGKKVLLVDADEQRSTSMWANQRDVLGINTSWSTIQLVGKAIYSQITRMSPDYDDVIIDVGGRETNSQRAAIAIADIYLIPFKPRSLDIWTLGDVKTVISEMLPANPKLKSYAVVNQADSKGVDNEGTLSILQECEEIKCIDVTLGARKAFANAASDGLGVSEMKNPDKKAIQEMQGLYDFIYTKDT